MEQNKTAKIKHSRSRFFAAVVITLVVLVGLHSRLFISLGFLNYTANKPQLELDALNLAALGFDADQIEKDVNRLIANMSNAQQGNHFMFGVVSGLIFSQPTAGLTVGLIKEAVDFLNNYRRDQINGGYFVDAVVDTVFWALGGFVGFYFLATIYEVFQSNNIRNPKDLVVFLGKKNLRKKISESV